MEAEMTSPHWIIGLLCGVVDEVGRTLSDALVLISMYGVSYVAAQYCLALIRQAVAGWRNTVVY